MRICSDGCARCAVVEKLILSNELTDGAVTRISITDQEYLTACASYCRKYTAYRWCRPEKVGLATFGLNLYYKPTGKTAVAYNAGNYIGDVFTVVPKTCDLRPFFDTKEN